MKEDIVRELAEEHWKYVESICHKMYVDAFIHGVKHGIKDHYKFVGSHDVEKFYEICKVITQGLKEK